MPVNYNPATEKIEITNSITYDHTIKPIISAIKAKLGEEYEDDQLSDENTAEEVEVFLNWEPTGSIDNMDGPYMDDLMESVADKLDYTLDEEPGTSIEEAVKGAVADFIYEEFNVNVDEETIDISFED